MRISVFGLGYVGSVSAACLAHDGHAVIGVDVSVQKVESVGSGRSPVMERGLDQLIGEAVAAGRLRATTDGSAAVRDTDVSLICVGTPGGANGSLDLQYVEKVCLEIGAALATKQGYHVVVVRSTVLPGTVEEKLIPILEECSGRRAGTDLGVCMNPEFLREGVAVEDYYQPSHIIIGESDRRSGNTVLEMYEAVPAPVVRTAIRTAEMVKYVNNAFHAVKVVFANEIGNLCAAHRIDGQEVMEIFREDRRLNISPAYLRPGFAFGGSCLPKDLRALLHRAKELDLECPLLVGALQSNRLQIQRGVEMVERAGRKKVGVLGLSFKAGTDDVRESPVVPLVETLLGRGYQVSIFDEKVDPARLVGANKSFLERELPHIATLMRPLLEEVVDQAEVVVVANGSPAFRQVRQRMRADQLLIDLAGVARDDIERRAGYEKAA